MAKKTYKKRVYDDYRKYVSRNKKKGSKNLMTYEEYKRRMYFGDKKVIESYEAYKRNRQKLIEKGHTMDYQMTLEEYTENYRKAKDTGMKNIARELANNDQTYTYTFARKMLKDIKDLDLDLIAVEEPEKYEDAVYLKNKYQTVDDIYGASSRSEIFNDAFDVFGRTPFDHEDKNNSWY